MDDNLEDDPFAEESAEVVEDFGDEEAFGDEDVEQDASEDAFDQDPEDAGAAENDVFNEFNETVENADDDNGEDSEGVALKEFENEWNEKLKLKDQEDQALRQKMKSQAKKDLDNFVDQRVKRVEAKKKSNIDEESALTAKLREAEESTNPWARIVSLIDVSQAETSKAAEEKESRSDVSRLRNLLIQLKNAPQAEDTA